MSHADDELYEITVGNSSDGSFTDKQDGCGKQSFPDNQEGAEICPMCLDPKQQKADGSLSVIQPCQHEFHTNCMYLLFSKCFVRECPMCRGPIMAIKKDNEAVVPVAELRKLFRHQCYGVRFRKESYIEDNSPYGAEVTSFLTFSEQTRRLRIKKHCNSAGERLYKAKIPSVVIELVDSDGVPQESHNENILVSLLHSNQNGSTTVAPDTVMMHHGVAVFNQIDVECREPGILAMKFVIQAPGLLVHHKAVFAAIDFYDPYKCSLLLVFLSSICVLIIISVSLIVTVYVTDP